MNLYKVCVFNKNGGAVLSEQVVANTINKAKGLVTKKYDWAKIGEVEILKLNVLIEKLEQEVLNK